MCTREFRARKRAQRDAANRRASAEANLPPRAASGAGRFRVGDEVTINGAHYRVTSVDAATGTVRGVPTDWNGPEHTIRERNAREREAMDAATIDRENPEAALAAQDAANVDRVTRERVHAAFEARQLAHREENARRETERRSQSRSQAEAAQTPAEAQREADMAIADVARTDFKLGRTSVGRIDASGGINGIGDAPIGKGFLYGGSNCYCEAETMEARAVYGLNVYPRRNMNDSLTNPDGTREWMDSFNDAKRHGTFHPANGYASSRDMTDDIYRIAAESPDRTVFRLAHDSHTNLIVKRRSNLVFIDAYSNRYITFGNGENDRRLLSMTLRRGEDPTYHGFVVIRPSAERARDLITGGNTVPTRRESSLENGQAVERRKYRKR